MRLLVVFAAVFLTAPASAEPAMWHLHNAETDIVLLGTMHALPANLPWFNPRIAARLAAADTLVLEAIVPDNPTALAPLVRLLGLRANLAPLSARVEPSKRVRLAASVAASGLAMDRLDGMKTWLAALTLGDEALANLGLTAADGVEAVLTAAAKANGKTVVGLETPEMQLRLFDGLSESDQRALLDATVDDTATARTDADTLVANWQAGSVDLLAADFDKEMKATPGLQMTLLTNRNARWANWIAGVMAHPAKLFIAVGAGHLAGPDSVVAMLRRKGFNVERLP